MDEVLCPVSEENIPLASRSWFWKKKRNSVFPAAESQRKTEVWVQTVIPTSSQITEVSQRSDAEPKSQTTAISSVPLPGSVTAYLDEMQVHPSCAIKSIRIDEETGHVEIGKEESWLNKLGINRNKLAFFKCLIGWKENKTTVEKDSPNASGLCSHDNRSLAELDGCMAKEEQPYIPYKLAKLYITKIVKDMQQMKIRHLKVIKELDCIRKENQEKALTILKNLHSGKMRLLKAKLEAYQELVENKNRQWQNTTKSLRERNRQLSQENKDLLYQIKQQNEKWMEEKMIAQAIICDLGAQSTTSRRWGKGCSKPRAASQNWAGSALTGATSDKTQISVQTWIVESFSQKLDHLYAQHSLTLHELQRTRLMMEKVHEIVNLQMNFPQQKALVPSEKIDVSGLLETATEQMNKKWKNGNEADEDHEHLLQKEFLWKAQALLEMAKQSLHKQEQEVVELLQSESGHNQIMKPEITVITLFKILVSKVHTIYCDVPEAQQCINHLIEKNDVERAERKKEFNNVQADILSFKVIYGNNPTDYKREQFSLKLSRNLMNAKSELEYAEAEKIALDCIQKGEIPDWICKHSPYLALSDSDQEKNTDEKSHLPGEAVQTLTRKDGDGTKNQQRMHQSQERMHLPWMEAPVIEEGALCGKGKAELHVMKEPWNETN